MLKLQKIYVKKSESEAGFTLLEVLVAMLIATFFVIGSMQALVLSTALRVKAQEKQRANQLIQEDIEQILFTAKELGADNSLCSATNYNGGYAEYLWNSRPTEPAAQKLLSDKGKTYKLFRKPASGSTAKILKIDFSVSPLDKNGDPEKKKDKNGNVMKDKNGNDIVIEIATDHIEVIPNAAIEKCPN